MPYCIKRLDCTKFSPERCEENGSYGCFLDRGDSPQKSEAKGSAGFDGSVTKVFSGERMTWLWQKINSLDAISTGDDIRDVIGDICRKLKELEENLK